jgi:hypothetical protein
MRKEMDDITSKLRTFQLDNGITDIRDIEALLRLTQLMKKQNFRFDSEKAVAYLFDPESEYEYSDMQPFQLNFDSNISICALFDDLFAQAKQRQENNKNVSYREILLRYLVGSCIINCFTTWDDTDTRCVRIRFANGSRLWFSDWQHDIVLHNCAPRTVD